MRKRFAYSIPTMTRRLLHIAAPVKGTLLVSTLASIIGNLSQMGLMGFGALLLLSCAGMVGRHLPGCTADWRRFPPLFIVLGRYAEGVVSHAGAYRLLGQYAGASVRDYSEAGSRLPDGPRKGGYSRVLPFRTLKPLEFFFAHTIGPMFTVILLPCVTLALALCFHAAVCGCAAADLPDRQRRHSLWLP